LSAADAGRLGRPVPAKGGQILYSVLSALKFDSPAGSGPFVSVLSQNSEKYAAYQYERLSFASLVSLVTAYYRYADEDGRTVMRQSLARFFAGQKNQSDRAHEHLFYDIAYGLEREANGEDGESPDKRNRAARELQSALIDLHDPMCRAFTLYDRPTLSTRVDQIHFLLRNGAACPGLPTVSELISKVEAGDWDEKASAFRTLVEMRGNAKQAEAVAIRYFKIEGMSRSSEIRAYCAQILGYTRTTNPEAHQLLIAGAGDFDSPVQDSSEKALGRLGLLVKPAILRYLMVPRTRQDQVREIRRRMAMVQTLGRMGRDASDAIPVLNQIAATDVDSYLQRMAKTAIVNIQENRTE
ncbi:MAG TPA: hypothetical protein PKX74_03690, partial [Leptospiraceae bacterium]|nr:hypothetical protein [Leptospiraceae bacterium]